MPEKETLRRARRDAREGKAPTTQAGEFVREEIHHVREGKHGARSTKQAIAIGLSKARRSGVALPTPSGKSAKKSTRRRPNPRRARASRRVLKRMPRSTVSKRALSRQARRAASRRRNRGTRR